MRIVRRCVPSIILLVVAVGIWEAIVAIANPPVGVLPGPRDVWDALASQFGFLLSNAEPTVLAGVLGYALAVILGVPLGYVISKQGWLPLTLRNTLIASQVFPIVSLAPLFVIWFGFNLSAELAFVFILDVFAIVLNAAAGFASVPFELDELGSVLGFRSARRFWRLRGPWALPQIFTGLKISAAFAVIAVVVFEFIGASRGLGAVIIQTQTAFNASLMYATVVLVTVIGFLFYGLIVGLESVTIPWHVSRRQYDME